MEHLLERYERHADDAYAENMDAQRVSPANVNTLLSHAERDEAGELRVDATLDALCTTINTLTAEHEQLRESIRHEAEAAGTAWGLADEFLDQRNALEAERDALRAEAAKLRDRCQVLILEKEQIRHTYQKHLGAYLRLVRESMHDALDAGIVPERLADDVNALRAVA